MQRIGAVVFFAVTISLLVACGCAMVPKTPDYHPELVCPEPDTGEWDTAPKFERRATADYPEMARRGQVEGTVVVTLRVSADGKVLDTAICESSGSPLLDGAALDAARRWLFHPAKKAGVAVCSTTSVPFNFRLN